MFKKRLIILFALLIGAAQFSIFNFQFSICFAQQRETVRTTLFGIGKVNHLDTYLSPMEYKGPQLTFLNETHRTLKRNPHVLFTTLLQGEFSYTENPTQNAHDMGGSVRYDAGWGRQWTNALWKNLDLAVGGMAGGTMGFLYNSRNGNNPAQARACITTSAFARADYRFRIKKQTLGLHYQAHLPLLGVAFMPQYGQSYYDLFDRGNYDHNIRCTHFGNAFSLRQMLTLDIPIRHATLSLGYLSDLRQLHVNGIRQHQYGRSFVIGYTRQLALKR